MKRFPLLSVSQSELCVFTRIVYTNPVCVTGPKFHQRKKKPAMKVTRFCVQDKKPRSRRNSRTMEPSQKTAFLQRKQANNALTKQWKQNKILAAA